MSLRDAQEAGLREHNRLRSLHLGGMVLARTYIAAERINVWLKELFGQRIHGIVKSMIQVTISITQVARRVPVILHRYEAEKYS